MAAVTTDEVFDFLKLPTDQRTQQETMIEDLIIREQDRMETYIGRKLEKETIANTLFQHNLNCAIVGSKMYLRAKYFDLYSITEIKEEDTTLVASTDYDDDGDYYHDINLGILQRIGTNWSQQQLAIKISGDLGMVDPASPTNTDPGIKELLIEMVAAKSGLWKTKTITDDGAVETIGITDTDDIFKRLQRYKTRII